MSMEREENLASMRGKASSSPSVIASSKRCRLSESLPLSRHTNPPPHSPALPASFFLIYKYKVFGSGSPYGPQELKLLPISHRYQPLSSISV